VESNGSEMTHVAGCQTPDAKHLGQRYDRTIDKAQAEICESSVHFHRA
jgi:hypothetical protein